MTDRETETPEAPEEPAGSTSANWKITVLVCVVILAAAAGIAAVTFMTEPTAKKEGATKKTAMLVDVVEIERGTYRPQIVATGTVEASDDIVLSPQVGGRIVARSDDFAPGGFVEKGQMLVKIEQADYRYALAQRKSELSEALSALAVEEGRRDVALAEYANLGTELPEEEQELVLRKPQLEAARERVEAARAMVEQAQLNLRRTVVKAPVDAHIIRRDVNVGSQVTPNDSLGRLVGMKTYWVALEVPLPKLRWISMPEDEGGPSRVELRNASAWPEETYREAEIFRLVGALDGDSRMARLLATVEDPLARENPELPPIFVGEFLEVSVVGKELPDVVRLNRDYVRDRDTAWVMKEGKLQIRELEIAMRDSEYAYVTSGLEDGDAIVTTNISTVTEGAKLRTGESDAASSGESTDGGEDDSGE